MIGDALLDLRDGLRRWPLWTALAWFEFHSKYRRASLGTLWVVFRFAFFVTVIGSLYTAVFGREATVFIPHMAAGFWAWAFLGSLITGGGRVFLSAKSHLSETPLPVSVFVFKMIWSHAISFAFHAVVIIGVLIVFDISFSASSLLFFLALIFFVLNGVWIVLLTGCVVTKFPDVGEFMQNAMRLLFFVTPIIWMPDMLGRRAGIMWLVKLNPLYHFIEVFRAPIVGNPPSFDSWMVVVAITVLGWGLAIFVFSRSRTRLPYWM